MLEEQGHLVLGELVRSASGGDMIESARSAWIGIHTAAVLASRLDGIALCDTNLLFYYQNRLAPYGVAWDVIAPQNAVSLLSTSPAQAAQPAPSEGRGVRAAGSGRRAEPSLPRGAAS